MSNLFKYHTFNRQIGPLRPLLPEYRKNRPLPNPKISPDALSNLLQVDNPTHTTAHAPERGH